MRILVWQTCGNRKKAIKPFSLFFFSLLQSWNFMLLYFVFKNHLTQQTWQKSEAESHLISNSGTFLSDSLTPRNRSSLCNYDSLTMWIIKSFLLVCKVFFFSFSVCMCCCLRRSDKMRVKEKWQFGTGGVGGFGVNSVLIEELRSHSSAQQATRHRSMFMLRMNTLTFCL